MIVACVVIVIIVAHELLSQTFQTKSARIVLWSILP